jgi:hypothetical protein
MSFEVSLGTEVFDPLEAEPLRRRSIGDRAEGAPDPNDTRIVQFFRTLTGPDIDRLKAEYGLALTAYVPNLAYIERVDAATRRRLGNDPLVRAIAPYRPEYKLDALLTDQLTDGDLGDAPIVASLFDGGSIPLVIDALSAAGATDISSIDNRKLGGHARVSFSTDDPAVIDRATAIPDIRFLELAGRGKADDVAASAMIQSGDDSNAAVWDRGIHGEGQIIGQLEFETLDVAHCFFADAPNTPALAHRKVVALRRASIGPHATFVAGSAVGDERGNSGAHANRGSAWAARLAASRVTGNGEDILPELIGNAAAGAFIHTNSWHDDRHPAGSPSPYNAIAVDTDTFCHLNEDHVVLGSSGNNGEEQGPPGTAKNALCVSAASADGASVGDGNPGPTADGQRKPDIVAVGCGIKSAKGSACETDTRSPCATSYATPHAAGAAALVRQYFMEGWYPTGTKDPANGFTPSGALIRSVLVNSAVNMSGVTGYPNLTEGWGLIQIDRALTFSNNGRNLVPRDIRNQFGLQTGEEWIQQYTVTAGGSAQQLRVVLAYTDRPGTAGAAITLVNDLDLEVTDPNGVKYVGNDFDTSAGFSRPNSGAVGDSNNTIEVVMVAAPVAGVWEAKVRAASVPVGRQGFALTMTSTAPPPSGGCFVATAVYGDPWHRDVVALRTWRDTALSAGGPRATAMRVLAAIYCALGPPAARIVTRTPRVRARLRRTVLPRLAARVGPSTAPPRPGGHR